MFKWQMLWCMCLNPFLKEYVFVVVFNDNLENPNKSGVMANGSGFTKMHYEVCGTQQDTGILGGMRWSLVSLWQWVYWMCLAAPHQTLHFTCVSFTFCKLRPMSSVRLVRWLRGQRHLAHRPEDLSLVPRTHTGRREGTPESSPQTFFIGTGMHLRSHTQ